MGGKKRAKPIRFIGPNGLVLGPAIMTGGQPRLTDFKLSMGQKDMLAQMLFRDLSFALPSSPKTVGRGQESCRTERTNIKHEGQAMKTKTVNITPKLAQKYLLNNKCNRNIRPKVVARYALTMTQERWRFTSESITLSTEGVLLDGQHRLSAIVASGKTIKMRVTYDASPESGAYMDQGPPRRISDQITMVDGEKSGSQLVALARALNLYDAGKLETLILDDVRAIIKMYRGSIDWAQERPSKTEAPRTAYFLGPLIWARHHGWQEEAEAFHTQMATLEGLSKGSPVIALRKALERLAGAGGGDRRSVSISMMTFSSLRAFCEDEEISSRSIHGNTVGFDYFNTTVRTIPKRRKPGTCKWRWGCVFSLVSENNCWLHENFKMKRNS